MRSVSSTVAVNAFSTRIDLPASIAASAMSVCCGCGVACLGAGAAGLLVALLAAAGWLEAVVAAAGFAFACGRVELHGEADAFTGYVYFQHFDFDDLPCFNDFARVFHKRHGAILGAPCITRRAGRGQRTKSVRHCPRIRRTIACLGRLNARTAAKRIPGGSAVLRRVDVAMVIQAGSIQMNADHSHL